MIPGRRQCAACGGHVVDAVIVATGSMSWAEFAPDIEAELEERTPVVIDAVPGPFGRYWRTDVAVAEVVDIHPNAHPNAHRAHSCGGAP